MRSRFAAAGLTALLAGMLAAGCSSSAKPLGATGSAPLGTEQQAPDGTKANVFSFKDNVPGNTADPTGMATPKAGDRLAVVDAEVCVGTRPVLLSATDFGLDVGAQLIRPKSPQTLVTDELDLTSEGECGRGKVVFEIPTGQKVDSVALAYTYDRQSGSGDDATDQHVTVRLTWPLRGEPGTTSTAAGNPYN